MLPSAEVMLAIFAGFSAAGGAIFSKLAFQTYSWESNPSVVCCFVALFVTCNVLMWWAFTKSLSLSNSTVRPLAVNTGTNFIVSGVAGYAIFGESISFTWSCGLFLILTGTTIILTDKKEDISTTESEKTRKNQ